MENKTKVLSNNKIFFLLFLSVLLIVISGSKVLPVTRTTVEEKKEEVEVLKDEVLAIEKELQYFEEVKISLETRLEVIKEQSARTIFKLDDAENKLNLHQDRYAERIQVIYKNGPINFLEVLLSSSDFQEFIVWIKYLARIITKDTELIAAIEEEKDQIKSYQDELEEQKKYQTFLHLEHQNRLKLIEEKKKVKEEILKKANEELKLLVQQEEEKYAFKYKASSSTYRSLEEEVEIVPCEVEPYYGQIFWVSEYMPRKYRTKQEKLKGLASWYGPGFHGKRTASGEVFNQNDFTCAHKTLPLGSFLIVSYKDRKIILKVNDRGPFIPGRVFDLSKAAAYYLGFTGVEEVEAEVIEPVF